MHSLSSHHVCSTILCTLVEKNEQIHINMSTYWHMQQCKSRSWLSLCSYTMLQLTHYSCWQVYPSLTFLPQQPSQGRCILATEKWTFQVKKRKMMNRVKTWHNLAFLHSHSVWKKKCTNCFTEDTYYWWNLKLWNHVFSFYILMS